MTDPDVLDRFLEGEDVEASPEVRELAQLAAVLQGAWGQAPTPASTVRARTAVLSAFEAGGNGNGAATIPLAVVSRSRGRRLLTRLALAAALVLAIPATAFAASADALPGQLLYPVKLGFEEVRLALAGDPLDEARVLLDIAEERVEEVVLSDAFGRDSGVAEALNGYEEAVAGFGGRVLEARALGLPVGSLSATGAAAFAQYDDLLETVLGPPPADSIEDPSVVPPAGEPSSAGKADDKGSGGGKGGGGHKNRGHGRGSAGGTTQSGGGGNGGGNGGGGNGGSGSGSGSGGGQSGSPSDGGTESTPAGGESNVNCGNGNGKGGAPGAGQGNGNGNSCSDVSTDEDDGENDKATKNEGKGHDEAGEDQGET